MDELERRLVGHMEQDDKHFSHISEAIDKIKDNHLAHMQASLNELEKNYSAMVADISWLKWGVMLLLASIVAVYFK